MLKAFLSSILMFALAVVCPVCAQDNGGKSIYDFKSETSGGNVFDFADCKGKVIVVINTAANAVSRPSSKLSRLSMRNTVSRDLLW